MYQLLINVVDEMRRRFRESEGACQNGEDCEKFWNALWGSLPCLTPDGISRDRGAKGAGGGIFYIRSLLILKLSALPDLRNCLHERVGTE